MPYSDEEGGQNDYSRKVKFQQRSTESISEGSFIYVPLNNYENDMEETGGEEVEGEEEYNEDYLTISEIKEEVHEPATEDLWDFYSTFQFDKCSKEDTSERVPEEEINQANEDEVYEQKSESNNNEAHKTIEDTEADREITTPSVIKHGSNEGVKREEIEIKEHVGVINDLADSNTNEAVQSNVSVDEVDSGDKSDSHDSEKGGLYEKDSK